MCARIYEFHALVRSQPLISPKGHLPSCYPLHTTIQPRFYMGKLRPVYSQGELQVHAEGSAQRYRQSTTRGQRPSVTHATERPSVATSATPPHFSCSLSFSLLPLEEHELEMVVESSSTLSWSLLYAAMVPHLCVLKPASFGRPACAHRRRTL